MNKKRYILFLVVVSIVSLEILLRLLGMHNNYNAKIDMLDCYKHFVEFNSELGYYNTAVNIECAIANPKNPEDKITYTINHDKNGARYTGNVCLKPHSENLHFYGCSVTWGHGVSDSSTFPFKVQTALGDSICVKNYGVGSYSTLQSYLLFEQNLAIGDTPTIAALDYGSFQDFRNTMSFSWREVWFAMLNQTNKDSIYEKSPNFAVPYASINNDNLDIKYYSIKDFKILKLRKYSAIFDIIYLKIQTKKESNQDLVQVSKMIIKQMKDRCDELDIDFVLCSIYSDENSRSMIRYFSDIGYNSVDISVEQSNPKYNLQPYDGHLNDFANSILAEKFVSYFKNSNLY